MMSLIFYGTAKSICYCFLNLFKYSNIQTFVKIFLFIQNLKLFLFLWLFNFFVAYLSVYQISSNDGLYHHPAGERMDTLTRWKEHETKRQD